VSPPTAFGGRSRNRFSTAPRDQSPTASRLDRHRDTIGCEKSRTMADTAAVDQAGRLGGDGDRCQGGAATRCVGHISFFFVLYARIPWQISPARSERSTTDSGLSNAEPRRLAREQRRRCFLRGSDASSMRQSVEGSPRHFCQSRRKSANSVSILVEKRPQSRTRNSLRTIVGIGAAKATLLRPSHDTQIAHRNRRGWMLVRPSTRPPRIRTGAE